MLSPIPSFTSKSTLRPPRLPIFLIFLSPLSCFCSSLLIHSYLTLSYYHAIDNHVVLFSSCSRIMCQLNLMFIWSLLPRTLIPLPALPPHLGTPFVFKLCISFNTRQSDHCVLILPVCIFCLRYLHYLLSSFPLFYLVFLTLTTSDPCPTIVQLLSNSGLWPPPWNYRTYR